MGKLSMDIVRATNFLALLAMLSTAANAQSVSISKQAFVKDGPFSRLLAESAATYEAMKKISDASQFTEAEKDSHCVLIFPKITTVALIAGGSHGDGVASCRNKDSAWSGPLFVNFSAGSIGVQGGVQRSKVVVFLTNDESQEQLIEGNLSFAPTSTFVAGKNARGETVVDGDKRSISIFSDRSGIFGGVALTGMSVGADEGKLKAFYEEPATLKTVVKTYSFSNPPDELTAWMKALPIKK